MGRLRNLIGWFRNGNKSNPKTVAVISTKSVSSALGDDPGWATSGSFNYSDTDSGEAALKASPWVYSCAKIIATSMSSIPLKVFIGEKEAPDDHKLNKLLQEPIPGFSQSLWLYSASLNLTNGGEGYLEKVRASALGMSEVDSIRGLTAELWPFPGSYFKPVVEDNVRRALATSYTPTVGNTDDVAPEDLIHIRTARPSDINAGLGPVEGAAGEINTDAQAGAWQQTALKNRGVPDGIFRYMEELGLDDKQEAQLEARIEDRWVGLKNAHRPFVIGRSLDWIPLAKTMVEMELVAGRIFTKSAICAAMGVPSVLFDSAGSTYANLSVAELQLLKTTVLPQLKLIVDSLNINLAKEYGDDVSVRAVPGASMAMLPMVEHQWEIAVKAMTTGAPMDQIFKSVGLDIEPYPGMEVGFVAAGLQPVDLFSIGGNASDGVPMDSERGKKRD